MGRRLDFLKDCYNTEMYSEGNTLKEVAGKYFGIVFSFFVVLPFYLLYLAMGYLIVQHIVKDFFSRNELLSNQWLWMLYGVLFGLFLSVMFQGMPKQNDTPKNIRNALLHHLIFLSTFIIAFLVWFIIILFSLILLRFIH